MKNFPAVCRAMAEIRCQDGADFNALRAGPALDAATMYNVRRKAVLDGCKWDPQMGDVDVLSSFPLILKTKVWKQLARQAEQLTAEAIIAEDEISKRPELLGTLGLPRALSGVLKQNLPATPAVGRVTRFDFHPTTEGWRISEGNSDVPGGFTEASHFTALIAKYFPNLRPAGNPAEVWTHSLATAVGQNGVIALLSAPGYMEDHEVVAFLAARLCERGCRAFLAKPEQIHWRDGVASLDTAWHRSPVGALVRFYQAEWLSRLPRANGWQFFFRGGKTLVANPPFAVISESKRFPLVWDKISTELPAWRALLPETSEPRIAPWLRDEGWLLKSAMCNTGDTVSVPHLMHPRKWFQQRMAAGIFPGQWIAQRRFESVPVSTPAGPRHACIGVYTVNGRAAGAYARLSEKPVIDFAAADVALLLDDE